MKHIKKIALILVLITGIHTHAAVMVGSDGSMTSSIGVDSGTGNQAGINSGNGNQAGINSGNGNQAGINSGNGNQAGINSGNASNIMLGGNGGYTPGSSNLNTFSSSNSGVPKLSLVGIVSWLASLMNQLIYVIIGAALVAFLFGILKLSFFDGKKPEAREQARKFMFWGIVSLFVMVSVWGLVKILQSSFFNSGDLIVPRLK